jgi:hypothetical protein
MGQAWSDALRRIDARRREGLSVLSPETAEALAAAYDRARRERREVVYEHENELHARCLSTVVRAERLRAALRARGVEVLDAPCDRD